MPPSSHGPPAVENIPWYVSVQARISLSGMLCLPRSDHSLHRASFPAALSLLLMAKSCSSTVCIFPSLVFY